jgi:hypothetical protein
MSGVCRSSPQCRKGPATNRANSNYALLTLGQCGDLSSLHDAGGADPNNEGISKSLTLATSGLASGVEGWHED